MKKFIMVSLSVIVILGGIITSLIMMNISEKKKENDNIENIEISEKITDECVEEYKEIEVEEIAEVNSDDEKLSPNAIITFTKHYSDCDHLVNRYEEVPSNLVNATREDIEHKYNTWNVKEFTKEKVVLTQEINGDCGEHYMLRDVDGNINIYKLDENGNETLLNETEIATEYLADKDQIEMENGLIVYGKENLNKLLEDFE